MNNELQYMALSQLAYDDLSPVKGLSIQDILSQNPPVINDTSLPALSALITMQNWTLLDTSSASSGLYAAAFQNPATNEIVFAFRGTETSAGVADFIADSTIAFGNVVNGVPQQFQQAAAFVSQVRDAHPAASFSFTGHSLGGGIAQYMTYWMKEEESTDVAAVTFNAVGICKNFLKDILSDFATYSIVKA